MAKERNKSRFERHEKKESSENFARHNEWESVAVIFLFPVLIFAALFDGSFE